MKGETVWAKLARVQKSATASKMLAFFMAEIKMDKLCVITKERRI
jgi:hypothetical protein